MTIFFDLFNGGSAAQLNSGTWDVGSTDTGGVGYSVNAAGYAQTTNTATIVAAHRTAPTTPRQFAQRKLNNNVGASRCVFIHGVRSGSTLTQAYVARHSGTNIAIFKAQSDGSLVSLGNVAHTSAALDQLRIYDADSTITPGATTVRAVMGTTTVLSVEEAVGLTGGVTGMRDSGTTGVQIDDFYGGDVADMANAPGGDGSGGGGGGGGGGSVVETINQSPANGIPAYKGLMHLPSGRLLHKGKLLHRLHADFFGPAGTYTPPAWLTTTGTATLVGPDTSPGRLELSTTAVVGATASLAVTPQLSTLQHRAIRIDIEGMSFSPSAPAAEWRLGATDGATAGGGAAQTDTAGAIFLHTGGENLRTKGVFSHLGDNADQRRQTTVLILPQDKEVFILEDDELLSWRAGAGTWVDGTVTVALSIKATAAAAVTLRLTSMTVTTYC